MNAVQIIKKLKEYSCEYEVYMFVVSDKEDVIASSLLYRNFKNLESAKEYFKVLINEYNDLSLDELYERF